MPLPPSDAELIADVRAGDQSAYAQLWARHERAARRLAHQVARPADADDLVSESFYRVLRAINEGGGPDGAFRPYLLSTLRRVNIDAGRSYHQRISLTDDDRDLEVGETESAADVALTQDEQNAAWLAWASLPETSRTVLWHLIIEEETPAQIAPLLGTTPNGVSARALRAKERLRQAFLQQHVRAAKSEQCEWTRQRLGEYVRDALSKRDRAAVERHLERCDKGCKAAAAELADVNYTLRSVVGAVILGGGLVRVKYLGGAPSHAAKWPAALRPRGTVAVLAGAGGAVAAVVVVIVFASSGGAGSRPAHKLPALASPIVAAASPPSTRATSQAPTRSAKTPARHTRAAKRTKATRRSVARRVQRTATAAPTVPPPTPANTPTRSTTPSRTRFPSSTPRRPTHTSPSKRRDTPTPTPTPTPSRTPTQSPTLPTSTPPYTHADTPADAAADTSDRYDLGFASSPGTRCDCRSSSGTAKLPSGPGMNSWTATTASTSIGP